MNLPYLVEEKMKHFSNIDDSIVYLSAYDAARSTMLDEDRWRCAISDINHAKIRGLDGIYHMTSGGSVIAITEDHDIIAHAHNANDEMSPEDLIALSISCGGRKIDGYDGNFKTYRAAGMIPVSYIRFDERYAANGWKREYGKEDIVFYMHESLFDRIAEDVDDIERWKQNHEPLRDYYSAKSKRDILYFLKDSQSKLHTV